MGQTLQKKLLPALLALLSGISLAAVVSADSVGSGSLLARFVDELDGIGPVFLVAVVALAVFYVRFWDGFASSCGPVTHVLAALLSAFMLIGMSYAALDSWDFIFGRKKDLAFALVVFAGCFVLFDFCISWLYRWLDGRAKPAAAADAESAGAQGSCAPGRLGRLSAWIDRHLFLFCFLVICACWLPYLIINLPGSIPWDGWRQIKMGVGIEDLSSHHPWLLSLVYGLLFQTGQLVSDNFGIFLIVACSFLVEALCYAGVCAKIGTWGLGRAPSLAALLFFVLNPLFGTFAQAVLKDSLYFAFLALFFALYVDLCIKHHRGEGVQRPVLTFALLFLVEMAVCLTRNEGVYLVIPADIVLFFFLMKPQRPWAVLLALCVGLCCWCVDNPLADAVGVVPGSTREVLSIPFQQTARYLTEYPDDVTEEEREAIDAVLDYDALAENYDPIISDDVKNTYHAESTEELIAYFSDAWLPMLQRHPALYLQSLLNSSYQYYYPFVYSGDIAANYFWFVDDQIALDSDYDIHRVFPDGVREVIENYVESWRHIPLLAQVVNPGTYSWVLLVMGGYLCREKRYKDLWVLLVPLLCIAVCIASPVNGHVRYAMPLIACTPVIICWCLGRFGTGEAAGPRHAKPRAREAEA